MQTDFVCSGHLLDWLHPPAAHIGFAFSFDAIALFYQNLICTLSPYKDKEYLITEKIFKVYLALIIGDAPTNSS